MIMSHRNFTIGKLFPYKDRQSLLHSSGVVCQLSCSCGQGRTQGGVLGVQPPPIGLSTEMHNKENITFLGLLSLFFCIDTNSNMI